MGLAIVTAAGSGVSSREFPGEKKVSGVIRINPVKKRAILERFIASLPGNSEGSHKSGSVKPALRDVAKIELAFNRKLKFVLDHESQEVMVKVIDPDTDKVIKILPPEEIQLLNRHVEEIPGFLFDERV